MPQNFGAPPGNLPIAEPDKARDGDGNLTDSGGAKTEKENSTQTEFQTFGSPILEPNFTGQENIQNNFTPESSENQPVFELEKEKEKDQEQTPEQQVASQLNQPSGENIKKEKKKIEEQEKKRKRRETMLIIFGVVLGILALVGGAIFLSKNSIFFQVIFAIFRNFWWLILTPTIGLAFFALWGEYGLVFQYVLKQKYVFLEIIPPPDVEKSPKIMEQVFAGLHDFATVNPLESWTGWRPVQKKFVFEIASLEGSVRFYVRCPEGSRNHVESVIYAQYPNMEVREAEDYTKTRVPYNLPNNDWEVWGAVIAPVFDLALPIRTYKHFQEDVTGKMIDPLASMTEVMSAAGKDQYIWLQIIFTPVLEDKKNDAGYYNTFTKFIEEKLMGKEEKKGIGKLTQALGDFFGEFSVMPQNILSGFLGAELSEPPKAGAADAGPAKEFNINALSPGQQEKLKAAHDYLSKPFFRTSIRLVYTGKRENYNPSIGVGGVMGAMKQFTESNLNGFGPTADTKTSQPLFYFVKPRQLYRKRKIVQNFRDRDASGTYYPMSIEALASIFHFPDMSVQAAGVKKVEAKKSQAPGNVPLGEFEESMGS